MVIAVYSDVNNTSGTYFCLHFASLAASVGYGESFCGGSCPKNKVNSLTRVGDTFEAIFAELLA